MEKPRLESLPPEVLTAIMSAVVSTNSLPSFICTSHKVYEVFLSAKRSLILSMVPKDLGSAVRDGIAAILYFPKGMSNPDLIEHAIQRYEAQLLAPGPGPATDEVPIESISQLVPLNRSVQFLIDEYAASRLPELHAIHPNAASPLTASERRRLARALIRHQILAWIESRGQSVADRLYGLFARWQIQQLADVSHFVSSMVAAATLHLADEGIVSMGQITPKDREKRAARCDLGVLHQKLLEAPAKAATPGGRMRAARRDMVSRKRQMRPRALFRVLDAGPLPYQPRSYDLDTSEERRLLRDELYGREDAAPHLVFTHNSDHDDSTAPFAWVDGHNGTDCQRWGYNARREVLDDPTERQREWMWKKLDEWRWMGFVFWDRPRVEMLKSQLPEFATGWLTVAPPPDSDCAPHTKYLLPLSKRGE